MAKFATLDELYDYALDKKLDFDDLIALMCVHFNVSYDCAQSIWYVSSRTRGTDEHISRMVQTDKIKDFDWNSVTKGEEDDEMKKHGI